MIALIVLIIFAWIVCAVITAGVLMHIDYEQWGSDWGCGLQCTMLFCIAVWPMLLIFGIGYVLLTKLSKLSMVVYGFLDYIRKGDE